MEWIRHGGVDAWLNISSVTNARPCDGQAAVLRYMRGCSKRYAMVSHDGHTALFPFQRIQ